MLVTMLLIYRTTFWFLLMLLISRELIYRIAVLRHFEKPFQQAQERRSVNKLGMNSTGIQSTEMIHEPASHISSHVGAVVKHPTTGAPTPDLNPRVG